MLIRKIQYRGKSDNNEKGRIPGTKAYSKCNLVRGWLPQNLNN
jgi:hypothetical protein